MEKTYLFILDDSGKRKATFLLGIHGSALEELQAKADAEYPGDFQLVGYGEEYFNNFAQGMIYVNGEFVGGSDIMREMYESGELAELVQDVKTA